MGTFPTYGMAGIGIAAAIGFVFVLSYVGNNNGVVDDGGNVFQSMPADERSGELAGNQENGGDTSMFAKDSQDAMDSAPAEEGASMMQLDVKPTLTSLVALDGNREILGEVVNGMEFRVDRPALFQVQFANENQADSADNFMTIGITREGEGDGLPRQEIPFLDAASLQAGIAAASSIELELHWTPDAVGNYTLLVFSEKSGGPVDEIVEPAASFSISVVE